MSVEAARRSLRGRLVLSVRYFLVGAVLISLLPAAVLYLQFRHDRGQLVAQETARLALVTDTLVRYLDSIALDLTRLAEEPPVQTYLQTGLRQDRERAIHEMYAFAKYNQRYAQVRLITPDGLEDIRVDFDGGVAHVTPDDALQDKHQRYYFREALQLAPGQIYVSPLDLNIEHEEIEHPCRPMIRFAMPQYDASGVVRAVLVLNFNAENLLRHFDEIVADEYWRVELLNTEGYWLRSADRKREWGFMFDNGESFARSRRPLWEVVSRSDRGELVYPDGVLLFTTLPVLSKDGVTALAGQESLGWKIVSDLTSGLLWARQWERAGRMYLGVWALLLFSVAYGSWVLAGGRLERREMQRERRLHDSVFDTASDAMLITDPEGVILNVNTAFARQSGYTREEVVGQRPRVLRSGRQDKAFYERMWGELASEGHWQGELWNRRKDGADYLVWLRITAIREEDGRLIGYMGLTSDITARNLEEERLRRQAYHDHLTGLASRLLFIDHLEQALASSRRTGEGVALCYLDLDRFKPINDRYGHAAGDHVLRVLAERMRPLVRDVDTLARIGGDEFAIILTSSGAPDAVGAIVARLQQKLREPIPWEGAELQLDSSVGIAFFPEDADSADELLRKADAAMYAIKHSGREGGWLRYREGFLARGEEAAPPGAESE